MELVRYHFRGGKYQGQSQAYFRNVLEAGPRSIYLQQPCCRGVRRCLLRHVRALRPRENEKTIRPLHRFWPFAVPDTGDSLSRKYRHFPRVGQTDHNLDCLDPNLPLEGVVRDIYWTDPTLRDLHRTDPTQRNMCWITQLMRLPHGNTSYADRANQEDIFPELLDHY